MSHAYQITIEELEALMRESLAAEAWTVAQIDAYVTAQKSFGLLRPGTTDAQLSIAELFYYIPPASGL